MNLDFPQGSFTALVGESGCGKSTIAALLMGRNRGFSGRIIVGEVPLPEIGEGSLMRQRSARLYNSYLFRGTVRENLMLGKSNAQDRELWQVLNQVNLGDFLRNEQGLDTQLLEQGSNLSGGQRQRLALARALLHDSPVYLFDEATSNIDAESENDIMEQIRVLAGHKTVILISHRLANVVDADHIYVLDRGSVVEQGTHSQLIAQKGAYAALWDAQQQLEQYGKAVQGA